MERNRINPVRLIAHISMIFIGLLLLGSMIIISSTAVTGEPANIEAVITTEQTVTPVDVDALIAEHFQDIQYEVYATSVDASQAIVRINLYCDALRAVAKEIPEAVPAFSQEIARVNDIKVIYIDDCRRLHVEEEKWLAREKEYPEATYIWRYMKDNFNWSDETCAGIIGNMMAEVGDNTLHLERWTKYINTNKPYGLIQWLGTRKQRLFKRYGTEANVEEQLLFMRDELYGENGLKAQVSSKDLKIILNEDGKQTPEKIAYVFADKYERCGNGSKAIRKTYARRAYEYFTS